MQNAKKALPLQRSFKVHFRLVVLGWLRRPAGCNAKGVTKIPRRCSSNESNTFRSTRFFLVAVSMHQKRFNALCVEPFFCVGGGGDQEMMKKKFAGFSLDFQQERWLLYNFL